MGSWTVTCLFLLICFQQCLGQSSTTVIPQDDITAYIIMGVILGVIVIVIIIILIVSCGRWNWNWREMNRLQNRKAVRVTRTTNILRRIRRKPKLKLGVKQPNFQQPINTDTNGSSRALFVMGESGMVEPERDVMSTRTSAGPHVATVELDSSYVPSTSHQNKEPPPPMANNMYSQRPGQSSGQHNTYLQYSNPNVSRVECADVRQVQMPSAIYPQLGDVIRPSQHQINIHAAVPGPAVISPIQQPVHHHHAQTVAAAQPISLYPNLGHTHAHVVTQHPNGHIHGNVTMSPPAYQTMERTSQKY